MVVGPEGEEVYVLDGEVQRTASSSQSAPEHLAAGQGRHYAGEAATGRPAEFDASAFARLLSDVDPLPTDPTVGLLAYEGFDYRDAQSLPDGTAQAGSGWASSWRPGFARPRNEGDTNTLALNVKESLTRPGAEGASLGGAWTTRASRNTSAG